MTSPSASLSNSQSGSEVYYSSSENSELETFELIEIAKTGDSKMLSQYLKANPKAISSDGEGGFGHVILITIWKRDIETLRYLKKTYPANFKEMTINGEYGLGQAILLEINHLNRIYEERIDEEVSSMFLSELFDHPHIHLVTNRLPGLCENNDFDELEQTDDMVDLSNALGLLLIHAFDKENESIARILLNSPLMQLLPPNGIHGLGRILVYAAACTNKIDLVKLILSQPATDEINSNPIDLKLPDGDMNQFGISEAVYCTVLNPFLSEKDKLNLIKAFTEQQMQLRIDGEFGLKFSFDEVVEQELHLVAEYLSVLLKEVCVPPKK